MTDDFRILIAATEKTGNTWLKHLLAYIYELPTPYISQDFSEAEADSLGNRWITHQHFDNGVRFVPILDDLLQNAPAEEKKHWGGTFTTSSRNSFFHWIKTPAEEEASRLKAAPRITNLAAFIYAQRPDLQAAFPDIFDLNRLGYAAWFLRYAGHRYQLDRCFLTPVALSRINGAVTKRRFIAATLQRSFDTGLDFYNPILKNAKDAL